MLAAGFVVVRARAARARSSICSREPDDEKTHDEATYSHVPVGTVQLNLLGRTCTAVHVQSILSPARTKSNNQGKEPRHVQCDEYSMEVYLFETYEASLYNIYNKQKPLPAL